MRFLSVMAIRTLCQSASVGKATVSLTKLYEDFTIPFYMDSDSNEYRKVLAELKQ